MNEFTTPDELFSGPVNIKWEEGALPQLAVVDRLQCGLKEWCMWVVALR